jgi:hypothetical protein
MCLDNHHNTYVVRPPRGDWLHRGPYRMTWRSYLAGPPESFNPAETIGRISQSISHSRHCSSDLTESPKLYLGLLPFPLFASTRLARPSTPPQCVSAICDEGEKRPDPVKTGVGVRNAGQSAGCVLKCPIVYVSPL